MKLLSTYLRGKSLTVCFAFPGDYDMANIEALNVSIGSKQFPDDDIDISGHVACVRLKSEDTYKLTGDYPIIISIDDKTRGVIPIYVGYIRFVTHRNSLNNASTNEENDIVIALSITQTTIDVDSVLYDVMAGKAATIEVGTVTTLEAGEDATIENTGTENEAVFNFGIPKGDKGDKGDAGDTPYIGVNGNWFINGVDTGVQAEGDATEAWVAQNYLSKLDVVGELGDSETKVVNQKGVTINNIKSWSLAESFSISSPTFDGNGYVSGGVITWPDGDFGSISNVTIGVHGITSIRYNRSEAGKYATVNIAYDDSGVVTNQEVVLTGF